MPQYRFQQLADSAYVSLDIYECVFVSDILSAFKSNGIHYHIVVHEEPASFFEKASAAVADGSAGAGGDGFRFVRYGAPAGSYVSVLGEMAFEAITDKLKSLSRDQKISLTYVDQSNSELYRGPIRHP
jgi:hypothetical protein